MKTSVNGAPILDGRGLHQVKERIQAEFEKARRHELVLKLADTALPDLDGAGTEPQSALRPRRPLAQIVAPILAVCNRRFDAIRSAHHHKSSVVTVPTETAEELIRQSTQVMSEGPKKEERHIVEAE